MTDAEIIKQIQQGEQAKALDELYKNYPVFKNHLKKAGGNSSDAEDIFQEALFIMLQKIADPVFTLSTSISGFLFGICRNLSYEYFRKKGKEITVELLPDYESVLDENIEILKAEEQKYRALDQVLSNIGKRCMELLSMFYLKNLSMAVVANQMGFTSENSAKTQKYKCLEKARELAGDYVMENEKV